MNTVFHTTWVAPLSMAGLLASQAVAAPLPALGADPAQTSVSGLSSGAFMAVQLQVAYSGSVRGAGIIAGGPYYCAANNIRFVKICLGEVPALPPNPQLMVRAAKRFASAGVIDPLKNLTQRRIYVFSGKEDNIVHQRAVDATVAFFEQVGVKPANLKYVDDMAAGHAVIAPGSANACSDNAAPFINQCSIKGRPYDQPGAIFEHIYGSLNPRADKPAGKMVRFSQSEYATAGAGLADTGYLYVPPSCTGANAGCRVHVALHGCVQSAEVVGDKFYSGAGYNNWADANKILVLYPQVRKSERAPQNPYGCWDWWGYTGKDYAYKSGLQMQAINAMVVRLTQKQ